MSIPYKPSFRVPYICTQCLLKPKPRRRFLTTTSHLRNTSPPARVPNGLAHLTNRSIISLSGADASKFLQGLTTNNVDPLRVEGWYSAFLNAQGRVLGDSIVYPINDYNDERAYLIEVDESSKEGLMKHLKRHKLRSKVQIRDASEEWKIWAWWSDGVQGHNPVGYHKPDSNSTEIRLPDPRLPRFGTRILSSTSQATGGDLTPSNIDPSATGRQHVPPTAVSLQDYIIHRYINGIPEGPLEILPSTALPLESNIDHLSGIDFRKGCYVGQELTIRTQHTGVVRKRILPIQLYPSNSPVPIATEDELPIYDPKFFPSIQPGTEIRADGGRRASGKILASIGNIGLALCRVENMTSLRVSAEGGTFKDNTEFHVGDTGVKVKAFVPWWLRQGEERKWEGRKITAPGEE